MKRFGLFPALGMTTTLGMTAALIVAACGGGEPTATPRPTAPASVPAAATPTAQPTATAAATATRAPDAPPTATATPRPAPTFVPTPTIPAGAVAQRGGILREANRSATASASFQTPLRNPALGPAHEWISRQLFHSIMWTDPYDNHELKGMLADRWQYSPTADQITFHAHPAATWSDGKPVTAQDFKANIDLWLKPPQGFVAGNAALTIARAISSVDLVDAGTIVIKLKQPSMSTLSTFAHYDALIKPSHRTLEENAKTPVGSTAFTLTDIATDVKFTLQKNPRYWLKGPKGDQLPYLDGVESIVFLDQDRVFAALLTGQLDIAHLEWDFRGKRPEDIQRQMPAAFLEKRFATATGWGFKNKPPFNDPRVLKAFHLATDRLADAELARAGLGVIDTAGVLYGSAGSTWALPMAETMSAPGYRYVNRKTGQLETDQFKIMEGKSAVYQKDPRDIAAAKALLREAGLDPEKGQFPSPLTLLTDSTYNEPNATVLAQVLKDSLGIKAIVDSKDFAAAQELRTQGKFDANVSWSYTPGFDPSAGLRYFTSNIVRYHEHGFTVPELDGLYERQDREVDPAKRKALVYEFQRAIIKGVHIFTLSGSAGNPGIIREWVKNAPVPIISLSTVFWWDQTWIDRGLPGRR